MRLTTLTTIFRSDMTRTERKAFIAKLREAKEMALGIVGNSNACWWAVCDAGLAGQVYTDPNRSGYATTAQFLAANGATAENIGAIFDNSIAEQERLL